MKTSPIMLLLVALTFLLSATGALAQSDEGTDQSQPGVGSGESTDGMQPGVDGNSMQMMGQTPGMMSPEDMMKGGMMHGAGMCPMMGMMNMMRMAHHGGGMAHEESIDHIEGRIAYLKAEIKITPNQEDKWNTFAEALRKAAMQKNIMNGQRSSERSMPWQDRLARHEERLQSRLDLLKSVKEAADPLFASLSDDQRKLANELLAGPMGIIR